MFFGTIPGEVQSIMMGIIKEWDCEDIFVGCSGNFTVEKIIFPLNKFRLHSNDVTFYSHALGRFLTGADFDVRLTEDGRKKIPWVEQYCKGRLEKLAVVLLASAMVRFIDKSALFYRTMIEQYREQFAKLHAKTVARLEKVSMSVNDYFNGDVIDFVNNAPFDAGFISYPPFSKAGKSYVKDFEKLKPLFEFDTPPFTILDKDGLVSFFEMLTEKKYWLIGTDMRLPEHFEPFLCAISKTTNRGVPIHIYSNSDKRYYVGARQQVNSCNIPRLMPGDLVGEHIEIKILDNATFQTLRSEYMNINIIPGSATLALGVIVDGKLIGVYAFSSSPTLSNWDTHIDTPTMYLLSDFPVEPVDYDRLAKLVLYAALSKESQSIAQKISRKRIFSLVTTAFTNKPVSMKYRGLFKVLNRKENEAATSSVPSEAYYQQRYQINYGAPMGQWSLAEGLSLWKKKHSQRGGRKEVE